MLSILKSFIKQFLPESKILLNENDKRLSKLKDIHKNRRAFVIGSGPSLRISDLGRLKDEITFACNKIFLAFNETHWRPTYLSLIDRMVAKNNCDIFKGLELVKIFSRTVKPNFPDSKDIIWIKDLPSPIVNGQRMTKFSDDLLRGTFGGYTVIYTMLQIAFFMGIREVYLLGIDFSFNISKPTGEKTSANEILLESSGEINHFHPDYREKGELWTMPRLDIQYDAFKVAKEIFEKNGGIIKNASRKTELDVFPLIDFDSLIL